MNVPSGSENNIPLTLACWKGIVNWDLSLNMAILNVIVRNKKQTQQGYMYMCLSSMSLTGKLCLHLIV